MMAFTHVLFFTLALPATAVSAYLFIFTLLSHRTAKAPRSSRLLRFDIIVPAHNEALVITNLVAGLRKIDWPAEAYRIIVVADNCSDDTAALARAAGARVLERNNDQFRGKGYALDYAFGVSREEQWAYAVVVVDADSVVAANLLEAFAGRIENGAKAIQAHYAVSNAHASWRTRLMSMAMAAFHQLRSRAREHLLLSCGIRGNGWCVTHHLLQRVPYRAFSLTEDLEYGIDLGLAGVRVHYADESHVAAAMVSGEQAARTQRQRWEHGRRQLIRSRTLPLLRAAVHYRSRICLDLALDLLVLPLSYVVVNIVLLIVCASLASWWDAAFIGWLWVGFGCAICVLLYVLRGWQLSHVGLRGLMDLGFAPFYVVWKIGLMLRTHMPTAWIRTKREQS